VPIAHACARVHAARSETARHQFPLVLQQ
jgi:hypothetical protein